MAITAVAVNKETNWGGVTEKFSNVYHYSSAANLDTALAASLADQIATAEKACHANTVTFLDARVWTVGGSPAQNQTLLIYDLSGAGTMSVNTGMYRESCAVARCDTNRNTATGKRIYLRKYYHSGGLATGSVAQYEGHGSLGSTQKNPFITCLESLRELTLAPGSILVSLCAPGGQQVSDSRPVTVLDYLHVRQFRR